MNMRSEADMEGAQNFLDDHINDLMERHDLVRRDEIGIMDVLTYMPAKDLIWVAILVPTEIFDRGFTILIRRLMDMIKRR